MAKAAGASVFHFCKVFHKATGLKFTDYVARVRLEDARTRLLNPNLRVSEIAYDVGFQSLTQFNRTFKRVLVNHPPSSARGCLPADMSVNPSDASFLGAVIWNGCIVANQSAKNALRLASNAEPASCTDFMLCA